MSENGSAADILPNRPCPVCTSRDPILLFVQQFEVEEHGGPFASYDVVTCTNCGAGYADRIPSQEVLDAYYRDMSKYENHAYGGVASAQTLGNYQTIVDSIIGYSSDRNVALLDIGCATGDLLATFAEAGFSRLAGIDPSPVCAELARRHHGIDARVGGLFAPPDFGRLFKMVTLSSVLEHVREVSAGIRACGKLLEDNGLLFIEVPDAERFGHHMTVPFQQFSMEHINFFSAVSLDNLMRHHGFSTIALWQDVRNVGPTLDPSLSGLFRKTALASDDIPVTLDTACGKALRSYIEESGRLAASVDAAVATLVERGAPIIVWGVGTHTRRLLATSALRNANIRAFVDSNPHYQGKHLLGAPIVGPDMLKDLVDPILVSTGIYQAEIVKQIKALSLANEIITLYSFSWDHHYRAKNDPWRIA